MTAARLGRDWAARFFTASRSRLPLRGHGEMVIVKVRSGGSCPGIPIHQL